ncbi:hypothetical protein PGTUg99_032529 [Puccinia graminis f. sp. tritici]|uniref:Uncharacterized protein n=1 Tax=Puccinia graminis f. sp. tritici TaxID=56615 RepID=A0A5B0N1A2_PUCGR|nr:hypothetical protein PGTUg99_032529 [Puccinia graminis f. sp. tritici]
MDGACAVHSWPSHSGIKQCMGPPLHLMQLVSLRNVRGPLSLRGRVKLVYELPRAVQAQLLAKSSSNSGVNLLFFMEKHHFTRQSLSENSGAKAGRSGRQMTAPNTLDRLPITAGHRGRRMLDGDETSLKRKSLAIMGYNMSYIRLGNGPSISTIQLRRVDDNLDTQLGNIKAVTASQMNNIKKVC